MATYTKTQIKKRVQDLLDKISNIRLELEELQSEVEDERDNIEPYEGKYDLTPAQEERQEWLDTAVSQIEEAVGHLKDAENSLEYID